MSFWIKRTILQTLRNPLNFYALRKFISYKRFFSNHHILIKKYVGLNSNETQHITIQEVFNNVPSNNIFLKVDIEGSEYRILDEIIKLQDRLVGVAIEFHDCDLHIEKLKKFIENFGLKVIHVHANNYGSVRADDNLPLVLEITFSSNSLETQRHKIQHKLDMANNPAVAEYEF